MSYVYLASDAGNEVKIGETTDPNRRNKQLLYSRGHSIDLETEVGGTEIERKFVEAYVRLCLAHSGLASPISLDYFVYDEPAMYHMIRECYPIWAEQGIEIMKRVIHQNLPEVRIPYYNFTTDMKRVWSRMIYHLETHNSFSDHFTCKWREEDELSRACRTCLEPLGFHFTIERKVSWVYLTVTKQKKCGRPAWAVAFSRFSRTFVWGGRKLRPTPNLGKMHKSTLIY